MADFIAIDFETASQSTNSACSIGIAVVDNLQIVDSFSSLIRPRNASFDSSNIRIHGITPDMVEAAPTLDELWPEIKKWFSPHTPVVAHNAHFDMSVLHESSNVEISNFPYVDTIAMVKPLMDGSHDLEHCADFFGIDIGHHHDAADDARACAEIAIKVIEKFECRTMWEFLAREGSVNVCNYANLAPRKTTGVRKIKGRFSNLQVRPSDIQPTVPVAKGHPLYGKTIVFTGQLSIERVDAMQMAANVGAINKSSVSSKTDYLVVGIQDKQLVGEDGKSTKEEKAYAMNSAGKANVKIIGEDEFMRLVKGDYFEGQETLFVQDSNEPIEAQIEALCKRLTEVLEDNHLDSTFLRINRASDYYSLLFENSVIVRVYRKPPAISCKKNVMFQFSDYEKLIEDNKDAYAKIKLSNVAEISKHIDLIATALQTAIDSYPKEWDCCHRFEECSNEGKCTHPDKHEGIKCGYRKRLAKGIIYYGKNCSL